MASEHSNDRVAREHWVHDRRSDHGRLPTGAAEAERAMPRRRASDRVGITASAARPTTGAERRRAALRRFRVPLIGLGVLGAAAPLTQIAAQPELPEPPPVPPARAEEEAETPRHADAEEEIAGRIGQMRAQGDREQHVGGAVQRYRISRAMAEDIYDVAREEGVDPRVAFGLVRTESTFREDAVSSVGARGLTQVMPRTAKWLIPGTTSQDLTDRRTNLRLGFRYLDQLIDKYGGNLELALTAYNRGPGTVDRVLSRGGNPDNGYAGKVLGP